MSAARRRAKTTRVPGGSDEDEDAADAFFFFSLGACAFRRRRNPAKTLPGNVVARACAAAAAAARASRTPGGGSGLGPPGRASLIARAMSETETFFRRRKRFSAESIPARARANATPTAKPTAWYTRLGACGLSRWMISSSAAAANFPGITKPHMLTNVFGSSTDKYALSAKFKAEAPPRHAEVTSTIAARLSASATKTCAV